MYSLTQKGGGRAQDRVMYCTKTERLCDVERSLNADLAADLAANPANSYPAHLAIVITADARLRHKSLIADVVLKHRLQVARLKLTPPMIVLFRDERIMKGIFVIIL